MARIPSAQPWAKIVRPTLSQWYVDPKADRVVVGLTRITGAARAAGRRVFGGAVELVTAPRATLLPPREETVRKIVHIHPQASAPNAFPNRENDDPPFYGGDEIVSYYSVGGGKYDVSQCTSAFDAYDTVNKWNVMVTAGHCRSNSKFGKWSSGYVAGGVLHVGYEEGTIDHQYFLNDQPDVMTITQKKLGTFNPHVFTGSATSGANERVAGSEKIATKMRICTDGVDSGAAICGATVTHTGLCVAFKEGKSTVRVCDLAEATYSNAFCIPGDSGGPVYADVTGKIEALGTIEGFTQGQDNCYINELSPALTLVHARLVTTK